MRRLHEAATWWVSFGAGFILAPFFSAQVLVDGFELFDGHFAQNCGCDTDSYVFGDQYCEPGKEVGFVHVS